MVPEYVAGAKGRFVLAASGGSSAEPGYYKIYSPSVLWNGSPEDSLPADGGRTRPVPKQNGSANPLPPTGPKEEQAKRKPDKIIQPSLFD